MDYSGIDRLIEVLEKASAASELRKFDSPPVVVNGKRGIWRMVRGFRTFIEVGANYKPQSGVVPNGKVLFGPPSLRGKDSGDIDDDTWAALTPKETNKKFSAVDVAGEGLQNLKSEVKESLGPDDTRRPAIDKANSVEELVPIARSAGFLDDEITTALKGEKVVPGETTEESEEEAKPAGNVVDLAGARNRLRGPKKTKTKDKPAREAGEGPDDAPTLASTGTDDGPALRPVPTRGKNKPEKAKDITDSSSNPVQGALAVALDLDSDSVNIDADEEMRHNVSADLRRKAIRARNTGEEQLAGWYEELANLILPARNKQNSEALERVSRKILEYHNRVAAEGDKPETAEPEAKPTQGTPPDTPPDTPETAEVPKTDKALIQDAIDNAAERVERDFKEFLDEAKGEVERAKELALAAILQQMEAAAKNPQVKMQLRRAKNDLRANKRNRRFTMMRLLRILRILMALVPG